MAHISRGLQGVGEGFILLCYYSVLASLFPRRVTLLTITLNAFENCGAFLGPLLGALFYQSLGY